MKNSSSIQGFLLDLDGTLIDSNDAHARAWQQALEENGFNIEYAELRRHIGMGGDQLLPAVASIEKDSAIGQKIDKRRAEIFRQQFLPQLKAFPGSREMLEALRAANVELVVATSASEKDLEALLEQTGLKDLLVKKTSSSEAEHSKPEPDIVQAALKKSGLSKDQVRMLGDTPYDLEAAEKAQVKSIGFTCGGWRREDLTKAEAVFAGPAEFLKALRNGEFSLSL